MSAAKKRILDGLEKAIAAEVDGYHFYMMAARATDDEKGRAVFEMLAEDEVEHADFLRAQHSSISGTGRIDRNVKLGPMRKLEGMSPIFSDSLKERTGRPNYEMSAVSIGSQLELSAIQFYRAEAEAAGDPEVKAFYVELADWEKGHYDALTRQLEHLRGEHWEVGGFSPY